MSGLHKAKTAVRSEKLFFSALTKKKSATNRFTLTPPPTPPSPPRTLLLLHLHEPAPQSSPPLQTLLFIQQKIDFLKTSR